MVSHEQSLLPLPTFDPASANCAHGRRSELCYRRASAHQHI